jgi:hypothetical protein
MYVYDTVSAAVSGLKDRGYNTDFSFEGNCLSDDRHKYHPEDFEIGEVYRFEGNSDPADEAVVYAIEGRNGQKGMLVTGFGPTSETMTPEMAKKLSMHLHE